MEGAQTREAVVENSELAVKEEVQCAEELSVQKGPKLSKYIRLNIYGFLNTSDLILRVSRLDTSTRTELVESEMISKNRHLTFSVPKACWMHGDIKRKV